VLLLALVVLGALLVRATESAYYLGAPIVGRADDCAPDARFAVIGDFGSAGRDEADVAELVGSWDVDFVVTVGDNNYPHGEAQTIDANIGQYYQEYIHPYVGHFGPGASENRFWPALGNHEWDTGRIDAHLAYFALPGNERYYDVRRGPVHLFVLDSDPHEPDGRTADSVQARWLRGTLAESSAPWRLVVLHHPPYTSTMKRWSDKDVQWPYAEWGADAVLAGHDHVYERLEVDGIPYFVNGLGGRSIYRIGLPVDESIVRYNRDFGAMLITADDSCINYTFASREREVIDSVTVLTGEIARP
jgi:hypothetical protein